MFTLDDDGDIFGAGDAADLVSDLLAKLFLELEAVGEFVGDAGKLGEAEHFALRDIADGNLTGASEKARQIERNLGVR